MTVTGTVDPSEIFDLPLSDRVKLVPVDGTKALPYEQAETTAEHVLIAVRHGP